MPTYLDFNSTATFRDFLISKTLQRPFGPQTFTSTNYAVQNLSNFSNVDPGDVKTGWAAAYGGSFGLNLFQVDSFREYEFLSNLNLQVGNNGVVYSGYINSFTPVSTGLVGIMAGANFDNDSKLMRFAAQNIRDNKDGPVLARITQNLTAATIGRVRLEDALTGNLATALNIVTGREPLIEKNYRITVAKTLPGKAIDFLQTVAGVEFPFSEIPGDYLTNPRNPIENRPEPRTQAGAILQDITGALGSLIGIQRRPKLSRKPSDLMIEYMGEGQKQTLYDNLSYSKYAPNYTTTARSQQSSKLFNFVNSVAQGVKTVLGLEAPRGEAYIGDDRGEDVKYTMSDFNDNVVKSNYYLSLMFDPVAADLFERRKNITEGGQIGGKLTWISKNSRNELGLHNKEWAQESTTLNDSLSNKYGFREDSILGKTQELLDSMPKDGLASRTHVGNVIDQTSRVFKEGETMLSRGSAIQYVDQFTNETTGAEYCRVWTKDRGYMNYSDTMKRTGNVRKFDDSVMSTPWNLNIAPMSDGDRGFEGVSTNIFKGPDGTTGYGGDGFYAKKYMFSIENLAWRTSNTPGFTYNDLPYCERGVNGGRVMWFPPYDLKISEQNSARWSDNTFLGRPEPIYTYQDTSRTGQLSFKVVVDHPSILNLLVREHFRNMSDEEAENYINAFFAGCKDLDFYDLIRRYTYLDFDDITLIKSYLEKGKDPEIIKTYKTVVESVEGKQDGTDTDNGKGSNGDNTKKAGPYDLKYDNDYPGPRLQSLYVTTTYGSLFSAFYPKKDDQANGLESDLNSFNTLPLTQQLKKEKGFIFDDPNAVVDTTKIAQQKTTLLGYFDKAKEQFEGYTGTTNTLKEKISGNTIQRIYLTVTSSCSSVASELYNEKLALRRSSSIINDFFERIAAPGAQKPNLEKKWIKTINESETKQGEEGTADKVTVRKGEPIRIRREFKLSEFGYSGNTGSVVIDSVNWGENFTGPEPDAKCRGKEFVTVKGLKINAPIAFYCRQSKVEFEYVEVPEPKKPEPTPTPVTRIEPGEDIIVPSPTRKPAIDPLKRIIMKTLSECYYFKKLEEDSPVAFKSLKEKLKYFHPAFHSTTPEGLNSRLTFMLQCVRPGDTIPIKGIADDSDLNARNTSFGPPPVCVLRIGDFYHSKVIIRDVNITYDDSPWDLNPEGIGVQPMIANVTCQIAFIGGQGLAKPIERLQNALSSNFFANTEMYDERSISTNATIGGVKAEAFTKKFLEELLGASSKPPQDTQEQNVNKINEGVYIGAGTTELNYTTLIDDVFNNTKTYFDTYKKTYNDLIPKYGVEIGKLLFDPSYRTINQYDIYTSTSNTPGKTLSIFGLYKKTKELAVLKRGLLSALITQLESTDLSIMMNLDKELTPPKLVKSNELITPFIKKHIEDRINELVEKNPLEGLESSRNKLITSLDKVNYVVKFGKDTKISGETATSATLSGFTYNLLYDEYSTCVDYIDKNTSKFYTDLTTSINFFGPTINSVDFEKIMKVLLVDVVDGIVKEFEKDVIIFPENVRNKIKNRIEKFVDKPKENKFKFSKFKERKNSKEVKFTFTETPETDSATIEEAKKVHSDNVSVTDKLNYYKNKTDKK
jgi:hypothetical protein